jgi:hypothetical protein
VGYVRVGVGSANYGKYVRVDYRGKGSIVSAEDINELANGTLIKDNALNTRHTPSDFTFKQNVVVPGNLVIDGNVDIRGTLNSFVDVRFEDLKVKDLRIFLNEDGGAIATGEESGIYVNRGGTDTIPNAIPDASIYWHEAGYLSTWVFKGIDTVAGTTKPLFIVGNDSSIKLYDATNTEVFSVDNLGNVTAAGAITSSGLTQGMPQYTTATEPAPVVSMVGGIYYQSDEMQYKGVTPDGVGGYKRVILG